MSANTSTVSATKLNPLISRICLEHRVSLPKPYDDWRIVPDHPLGHIHGLPSMRGQAIATNGIMVLLITSANTPIFGHLQWFIADPHADIHRKNTTTKTLQQYDEFF